MNSETNEFLLQLFDLHPSLHSETFLVPNGVWLSMAVVLFLGLLVSRLIGQVFNSILLRVTDLMPELSRDDYRASKMIQPLSVLSLGWLWMAGLLWIGLPSELLQPLVVASKLLTFFGFIWTGWKLVDLWTIYVEKKGGLFNLNPDSLIFPIITRSLKLAIICLGVLSAAEILDLPISSLIAGLGIGGMAIALAGQTTLSNLFGSVTVLVDKPFKIGDYVVVDGIEGSVERLGFRSTRIRTFYNSLVTVPNSNLITASVDNYGERQYRRFKTNIAILYETEPKKIEDFCEGIKKIIQEHPKLRQDYYIVSLNGFGDSSLDILLYCFFKVKDYTEETTTKHELILSIIELAHALGVGFAYPTRTLYMANAGNEADNLPVS